MVWAQQHRGGYGAPFVVIHEYFTIYHFQIINTIIFSYYQSESKFNIRE